MRRGADGAAEIGRAGRGALKVVRAGFEGAARPERPRRWTLPITALRVTPPSCLAIWLAERPSCQSFLRSSTRSSVQPIFASRLVVGLRPAVRIQHLVASSRLPANQPPPVVNKS